MIQFKRRDGRYQPFKDGKNLDLSEQKVENVVQGVYARASIGTDKDELYQEMHEGPADEEDDSQEEKSVHALPKEVMEAMEHENYSSMEIPEQQEAPMLHQEVDSSIFDDKNAESSSNHLNS